MVGLRGPAVGAALGILGSIVWGLVLVVWGGIYLWGATAQGTVVELLTHQSGSSTYCRPVVAYEVGTTPHRMESMVSSSPCGWEKDETVTVYFRADNPADGYLFGFSHLLPLWALTAAGFALFVLAARAFRAGPTHEGRRTDVAARPVVALEQAPDDVVVGVRGTVNATGSTVESPMSGRRCLAYEVAVRRPVFGERGELIHRAFVVKAFELREESGAVASLGAGVAVEVALEPRDRGTTTDEPSKRLTDLLTKAGFDPVDARTTDNDYEWTEGFVEEGDEVVLYACFGAETEQATGATYRAGARRFVAKAPPDGVVLLSTAASGNDEQQA